MLQLGFVSLFREFLFSGDAGEGLVVTGAFMGRGGGLTVGLELNPDG